MNKKTHQAIDSLAKFYQSLRGFNEKTNGISHALQLYHGADKKTIEQFQDGIIKGIPFNKYYPFRYDIGGRGSGKSVVGLFTALCYNVFYPDNAWVFIRKQWKDLKSHIMKEFERVVRLVTKCDDCVKCPGHPERLIDGPYDRNGYYEYKVFTTGAPSQILVYPEGEEADTRAIEDRLKNVELGGFFADEVSQLKAITLSTLQDNVRRQEIPSTAWCGLGVSNPVVKSHPWLHEYAQKMESIEMLGDRPDVLIIRSHMEDNPFLPDDYIARMKKKYKSDPIRYGMYIEGRDGIDIDGTPVFPQFSTRIHVNPDLQYNRYSTMYIGMDFGYHHPAAVWLQKDAQGCWNILAELLGQQQIVEEFARDIKALHNRLFPAHEGLVEYYGDPAGKQKTDKGDTTMQRLAKEGIYVASQPSKPEDRAEIMRGMLLNMRKTGVASVDIRPEIQIHPRCQTLIQGFTGGYHYKSRKDGNLSLATPYKDGIFDHLFDALGYCIINVFNTQKSGRREEQEFMEVVKADTRRHKNGRREEESPSAEEIG